MRFGATPVINTIGTLFVAVTIAALYLRQAIEKRSKTF
jgi:ABC-type spermidine/putrescine transport system permease subunit II